MRRPAKTLLVGTIAAIPLWVLSCGVATSQSTVFNDQTQTGDIFAGQTLDVVSATDDTVAVTTATGNSLMGSVESGSVDVQSTQRDFGSTTAETTVNVSIYSGANASVTTAATGNTSDVGIAGGGAMTGNLYQEVDVTDVHAESQVNGLNAQADAIAVATQAIANSQGYGATNSSVEVTGWQLSGADVQANAGAVFTYQAGEGSYSSAAVGNNLTSVAVGDSATDVEATQNQYGAIVQATSFTAFGNAQISTTAATATANNINVTNESGQLTLTDSQTNASNTRAQAEETSWDFGGANVSAYAVANSVLAGDMGINVDLDNTQVNGVGGVESIASFQSGGLGYDGFASSTAMGNAATGFACSDCLGSMSVRNSQTNGSDVSSTSYLGVNNARSARGTATSIGNNASFFVTQPNGH